MVRTVRAVASIAARPPWVRPGHFYSPATSAADVGRALSWPPEAPGVDLREGEQLRLASELMPLTTQVRPDRYHADNTMYGIGDASVYSAMLRRIEPRRVIEVGSGFSTATLLDTAEQAGFPVEATCIEPYPDRLLTLLRPWDDVRLLRAPVQDVPLDTFDALGSGDVLFIDSTHVAKAGSDVLWLLLRVLPRLAPGVHVHLHDIFWPFEYPEEWLREGRDWTEAYLLHAFLCDSRAWEITFFSSWLWRCHPELVPEELRVEAPGSIWIRRRTA